MPQKKLVKVTVTGYFEIRQNAIGPVYESSSYEEALKKQQEWLEEASTDPNELFSEAYPIGIQLEYTNDKPKKRKKNKGI